MDIQTVNDDSSLEIIVRPDLSQAPTQAHTSFEPALSFDNLSLDAKIPLRRTITQIAAHDSDALPAESDVQHSDSTHDFANSADLPNNDFRIICGAHDQEVILICLHQNCDYKRLICAKCVGTELAHISKHSPMSSKEDLYSLFHGSLSFQEAKIQEPSKPTWQRAELLDDFSNEGDRLIEAYAKSFKAKVQLENSHFAQMQRSLELLGQEKNKLCANSLNLDTISRRLTSVKPEEIDNLVKDLIKRKAERDAVLKYQADYITRCTRLYSATVTDILEKPSCFTVAHLYDSLSKYAEKLFDRLNLNIKVTNLGSKDPRFVDVKIQSLEDLAVLTVDHILPRTRFRIDMSKIGSDNSRYEVLQRVSGLPLEGLDIDLRWVRITDNIPFFLPPTLIYLNLDFFSSCTSQKTLQSLLQCFDYCNKIMIDDNPSLARLRYLRLGFGNNELTAKEARIVANILSYMNNLYELELDFRINSISSEGALSIIRPINSMMWLSKLNLDFSCITTSSKANNLDTDFYDEINLGISLQHLRLSFGSTGLTSENLKLLGQKIFKIPQLIVLHVEIFSNPEISLAALLKFCKCVSRLYSLKELSLNLNNQKLIKADLLKICELLASMAELEHLELVLKNCLDKANFAEVRKSCLQLFGGSKQVSIEF